MNGDLYRPVPWPHRPGIIRPVPRDLSGRRGPTPNEVRGPYWKRTSPGWHLPAWVDLSPPEQRIVNAAVLLPHTTGITGWAALRWMGGFWFNGRDRLEDLPVPLVVGAARVRAHPGIAVSQERLNPKDLTETDGIPCTIAARSVCFEARYAASLRGAVEAIDMAAYNDLVTLDEVAAYALAHPGWTGIPQAREAIALADENSWSPQESRMRLIWQFDAGLGRPLTNTPIFDLNGRHIATPDLLDPVAGVCGEYDGAVHLDPDQRRSDILRAARLVAHGLEVVRMIGGDKPRLIAQRLRDAYARADRQSAGERSWTIQRPRGWPDTSTVLLRRSLRGEQGAWALAHRQHPTYGQVA